MRVKPVLFAADLDRTLIYSRSALGTTPLDDLVAVETYEGEDASWMTRDAASVLRRIAESHRTSAGGALVVPATTRTVEQYRRVRLPGPPPTYAIAANGGVLLVDGKPDPPWAAAIEQRVHEVTPLIQVWEHAARACGPEWTVKLRNVGGLFCYAVLHRRLVPPGFFAELSAWADSRGWSMSVQGRKLYLVPRTLTKSAALAEVARRVGAEAVYAAGDSLLDADLLEAADLGIVARHGELVASGWRAAHVRVTRESGVGAGAEIVRWCADRVDLAEL